MAGMDRQNSFLILDAVRGIMFHEGMPVAGFRFVGVKIPVGKLSDFDSLLCRTRIRRGLGAGRGLSAVRGGALRIGGRGRALGRRGTSNRVCGGPGTPPVQRARPPASASVRWGGGPLPQGNSRSLTVRRGLG